MSLKVIAIPIVAAGVALTMFKLVSLRRAPSPSPAHSSRPRASAPLAAHDTADARLTSAAGVLSHGPASTSVLPIAFWDAAGDQLEDEQAPVTPRMKLTRDTYDSIAPEDLGVEWLSRATEAFDVRDGAEDDPAEVAADSMSMISEATRFAAASPSDAPDSELLDDPGPESSLQDDGEPSRT